VQQALPTAWLNAISTSVGSADRSSPGIADTAHAAAHLDALAAALPAADGLRDGRRGDAQGQRRRDDLFRLQQGHRVLAVWLHKQLIVVGAPRDLTLSPDGALLACR
jgi:hypothetical protein